MAITKRLAVKLGAVSAVALATVTTALVTVPAAHAQTTATAPRAARQSVGQALVQPKACGTNGIDATNPIFTDPVDGTNHSVPAGQYICAYGQWATNYTGNHHYQLWVIGTDGHLYETWNNSNTGNWSFGPWTSLGGVARSAPDFFYVGNGIAVQVLGTTGDYYNKNYNYNLPNAWWPSQTGWNCGC